MKKRISDIIFEAFNKREEELGTGCKWVKVANPRKRELSEREIEQAIERIKADRVKEYKGGLK
jgi:hypothetical protein